MLVKKTNVKNKMVVKKTTNINKPISKNIKKKGFIDTVKSIILSPNDFFESVKDEKGFFKPWIFFIKIMLIFFAVYFIAQIPAFLKEFLIEFSGTINTTGFGIFLGLIIFFLLYIFLVALSAVFVFIGTAILHLFLLIVGARKGYLQTFKMMCYSTVPSLIIAPFMLLLFIPFIGTILTMPFSLASWVYSLVLQVIGASKLHEISVGRAIVAVIVIPIILGIIIFILFIILFAGLLLAASQSGNIAGMASNVVV